jgi:hypothetical protein
MAIPLLVLGASAAPMVRDVLYFGRNRSNGGIVTNEEWAAFLADSVPPRFPDGFTVVEGCGQWRGESGAIAHERTEIASITHESGEAFDNSVREIKGEYLRRFEQEAVLWERSAVCASF